MTKAKVLQTTYLRMLGGIFMHSIFVISCDTKFVGQTNPWNNPDCQHANALENVICMTSDPGRD